MRRIVEVVCRGENLLLFAVRFQSILMVVTCVCVCLCRPANIEGEATVQLCLHDIQFQLCEFDKYLRIKENGTLHFFGLCVHGVVLVFVSIVGSYFVFCRLNQSRLNCACIFFFGVGAAGRGTRFAPIFESPQEARA